MTLSTTRRWFDILPLVLNCGVAVAPRAAAQQSAACWEQPPDPPGQPAPSAILARRIAQAVRIDHAPPRIDGVLDATWCAAPALTDLVQSTPNPGVVASLPTLARVLYDDDAVYVAVRLFDSHPDSIVAPFPRRDNEVNSDWTFVEMDTRHDHRTGYSFGLNPRGVQVDGTWTDDVNYDSAWNGVWEGASRVDSLGWTAEFRIPFSQLALGTSAPGTPLDWGLNIYRYSPHRGETSNWSPRLPSVTGVISHLNDLVGLVVPPHKTRFELEPYVALSGTSTSGAPGTSAHTTARAGAELRFRPTASTSVQLSLHPDFGQVEADPSLVNLSTFETFLPEQRPLFVGSNQLFSLGQPLVFASRGTAFDQEAPFYSRRVGRSAPFECAPTASACRTPNAPSVIGALQLSGRTTNGWSGGALDAWTGTTSTDVTTLIGPAVRSQVSPLTQFVAGRAVRELDGGRAAIGAIVTSTGRFDLHAGPDSLLARSATVLGMDARARLHSDTWEVSGFVLGSRTTGTPGYIARLRREPLHGYGRPRSVREVPHVDSAATSLQGVSAEARVERVDGALLGGIATRVMSQGFEANDLGFQRNANWMLLVGHWRYQHYQPSHRIRRWSIGSNQLGAGWTMDGLRRAVVANVSADADFRNYWGGSLSLDHEFAASDPEMLRGGPALLLSPRDRLTLTGYTDSRRAWQIQLTGSVARERASRSRRIALAPAYSAFVNDRLELGVTPELDFDHEGWQYVATAMDDTGMPHYLLGALRQTTASLTTRATYAFTAHFTLQLYAQLFLSGGRFNAFKEVLSPQAHDAASRVALLDASHMVLDTAAEHYTVYQGLPGAYSFANPNFSERDLHVNLLMRWEFHPGSTLFLVWTHQRASSAASPFDLGRDLDRLWRAPEQNVLLAKISYWIGR